jgi:hypothetical protein
MTGLQLVAVEPEGYCDPATGVCHPVEPQTADEAPAAAGGAGITKEQPSIVEGLSPGVRTA